MKVVRINDFANVPQRKFQSDAGLDLYSDMDAIANPHSFVIVSTGIAVELPRGTVGLLYAKSKSNFQVGAGVIDANYRGQIFVKIINYLDRPLLIGKSDPIAQLIVFPVVIPEVDEVEMKDFNKDTDRGETGGVVTQFKTATFTAEIKEG